MSESIHVKMPHCWKSHVTALIICHGENGTFEFECLPFYPTSPTKCQLLFCTCNFLKARFEILVGLFVCFVALRPKSTAMVIAGRSVHLATLFPGQA